MEQVIFNERHHAYLIGLFYREMCQRYGAQGQACFVKATQYIAGQRGQRMALRAIRDGLPLDYSTYVAYSEIDFVLPNATQTVASGADCVMQVNACVWQQVFREMNLTACGIAYCAEIDRGLVRGFNPDLAFTLKSTLHDSPCCQMVFHEANLSPVKPPADGKRGWDYHCGHYYQGYSRYAQMVLADGEKVARQVAQDFAEAFGEAALQRILCCSEMDFDRI